MFFLSLETSITVAFRSVLDELLCFLFALNLTSLRYFFKESFVFAFLFAFRRKLAPKIPGKFPRNRPFSPRICLFKSREISLFFPRTIRSPNSTNTVKGLNPAVTVHHVVWSSHWHILTTWAEVILTLMMTSAQVVETSGTVTDNSPFQDYPHLDDHNTQLIKLNCY